MDNNYTTQKGNVIDLTQILDLDSSLIGGGYVVYVCGEKGISVSDRDYNQIILGLANLQMENNRDILSL